MEADPVPGSGNGAELASRPVRRWVVLGGVALVLFALLAAVVSLHPRTPTGADRWLLVWIQQHRVAPLTAAASLITMLGQGSVLVGIVLLAAVRLWWRGRRTLCGALLAAAAVTAGLVTLLKLAVARPRPDSTVLIGTPVTDYAFPSGHTTDSTVVFVLLAVLFGWDRLRPGLDRLRLAAAALVALLVGLTRLYLGYHYLTDVLAGWLLATALVSATVATLSALETIRAELDPVRSPATAQAARDHG